MNFIFLFFFVFLVGVLQLIKNARLTVARFFHLVFGEKEESISCTSKRRVAFKKGYIILLTNKKSTENVNITFL